MPKYSLYGSKSFDSKVDHDMHAIVKAVRETISDEKLLAVILTGGYGRGEGTAYLSEGKEVPFNDYDMIVVAKKSHQHQAQIPKLEENLSLRLGLPVDLYLHSPRSLKNSEFSLMNTEIKYGHKVVYGDQKILNLMPKFSLQKIPLEEGSRLLMNRGKLLLDIDLRLKEKEPLGSQERLKFAKFLMKNTLAFGDCLFMAARKYQLSYAQKSAQIGLLAKELAPPDSDWIIKQYHEAVAFKNSGGSKWLKIEDLHSRFKKTKEIYLNFVLWYEGVRLAQQLNSFEDYVKLLPKRQPLQPTQHARAIYHNFSHLRDVMTSPSLGFSWVHPRFRLLAALGFALRDGKIPPSLLSSNDPIKRFYALRGRFA